MAKRKFSAGWYAGSVREAKRAAYLAGGEATLDLVMKTLDAQVKRVVAREPMPDSVKAAFAELQMAVSTKVYEAVIAKVLTKTPFDPPTEELQLLQTEREPDTADRNSQF